MDVIQETTSKANKQNKSKQDCRKFSIEKEVSRKHIARWHPDIKYNQLKHDKDTYLHTKNYYFQKKNCVSRSLFLKLGIHYYLRKLVLVY